MKMLLRNNLPVVQCHCDLSDTNLYCSNCGAKRKEDISASLPAKASWSGTHALGAAVVVVIATANPCLILPLGPRL